MHDLGRSVCTLTEELSWRGLITDISSATQLSTLLPTSPGVYCGFDPTARSLHVGNLVGLLLLRRLQDAGARPYVLLGGATGLLGDPSGKHEERVLLPAEEVEANVASIAKCVDVLFPQGVQVVNNKDWVGELSAIDLLREYGKHFRVSAMLAKESVAGRMAGSGISYTEFSYQVIQGLDFAHLHASHGVNIQLGGSDQWGNITAGLDLIRRRRGTGDQPDAPAVGLTYPLLTTGDGVKLGKSAGNAVWLDPDLTPPYQLYQYFMRAPDDDLFRLLAALTFLDRPQIASALDAHALNPKERSGQELLAHQVTQIVHGIDAADEAQDSSRALFASNGPSSSIDPSSLPTHPLPPSPYPVSLVSIVVAAGLAPSKAEAKRIAKGGGLYVNDVSVDPSYVLTERDLDDAWQGALVRVGKRKQVVVTF